MTPLEAWSTAAVVLCLKTFALAMLQGHLRIKHRAFVKPEDASVFGHGATPREAELDLVARAQGALRNDGENVPLFLAVSLAYVLLDCRPDAAAAHFGVFVGARLLHAPLMLWPRQPWRTIVYGVGLLCTLSVCGHVLWRVAST